MTKAKTIDDYLFRPSPDYPKPRLVETGSDPFTEMICRWVDAERKRDAAAQNEVKQFADYCVRYTMERTDEQHILDRCKLWFGERS